MKIIAKYIIVLGACIGMAQLPAACSAPEKGTPVTFEKKVIWKDFLSEGIAVADVNKDGKKDILSGAYWFEAPDWTPREITKPVSFDPNTGYSDSFLNFAADVNEDGWPDLIVYDFPGKGVYWFENPQGKNQHWQKYRIDEMACNESPMALDLDGNGKIDLVYANEVSGTIKWATPDKKSENGWLIRDLSEEKMPGTGRYSHGMGLGDINKDKRSDLITRHGWWEAPRKRSKLPWKFHPTDLGDKCSQMYTYDFDGDGDNDVVSASAHAYGIWWHEQTQGANGEPAFTHHLISEAFSQTHSLAFEDINGDGLPDLITGKRHYAHLGKDPGGKDPAVLYWFELTIENNKPRFIPHQIDDDSGVGLNTVIEDMDGNGKPDIVSANKKGVFVFFQQ